MKRDEMIEENLGLVHACARRFTGRGAEYDDLVQAGCVGLIKAVDNFDESRGFSFSTYAVPVILGEIKRIFRDDGTVKISRIIKERSRKVAVFTEKFSEKNGREPNLSEIAKALEISEEDVAQAINAALPVFSLTDDDSQKDFDVPVESYDTEIADRIALNQTLKSLDEKDRQLIELRYFKGLTQAKTAAALSMTQVQVSRKEKALLSTLRKSLG
ncbi:MAG: sigma-70 family RNA polymerase sigma factor [Clostridia bacterium]|nr:sigma-70 family RNA polymerase sigma factor [Clostridia bacterium]